MKCLVINLDRSSDRLAHVIAEFDRIGIPFERIAAVDALGRPDLASLQQLPERIPGLRLTDTEIACVLSHRACWSIIAAGDDAHVAVFEDDVVFSASAGVLLADAGWVPADADIVKLETFFQQTTIGLRRVNTGRGSSVRRLHTLHTGSAGYILSKRIAGALVEATDEIDVPADHVLFDPVLQPWPDRIMYQLSPALCAQEQHLGQEAARLPSLIEQERRTRFAPAGKDKEPRRSMATKVMREIERLARRLAKVCRLRYSPIVPFEHHGQRVRPPHTQRRENTL
ncbi:MAG: glycosyltransferase family 25 protein [Mesorhizobium sp.]|nr:glycosyltransferase family 25 protein [Mesorhizobium sp. M1D.F.Ca.ET.043.01.1.1]RWA94850.1 MAG: glycosyltransferase family 25 protein [Mesorhizobium sp.]RWE08893.1 MAG: glycosyltransferase family 25 protein [Mesorhizobium sp.]